MSNIPMKRLIVGEEGKDDGPFEVIDAHAVRFDEPQELSPEEQTQARENVGAVSAAEVTAIVDAKLSSITNAEEVAY